MKYGYMLYQKPVKWHTKIRLMNIGDSIQSLAVKNLYREMGVAEEDIIPVPRYDMKNYAGEECVCVVNGASCHLDVLYDSHFMPPSKKVHVIPMSLWIHRDLPEDELEFYRTCGGVGCRDIGTMEYLKSLGIDSYLTGCLTLTFPRRTKNQDKQAKEIYFVDVSSDVMKIIPEYIKEKAILLSNIIKIPNTSNSNRMPIETAYEEYLRGEERINLLRDTAKLVVTSRLHIASPCLAMGIPVILVNKYFEDRFRFIDCLIPAYTEKYYSEINWNPEPVEFEELKQKIKQVFFDKVRATVSRIELESMWSSKIPIKKNDYNSAMDIAVQKIPFVKREFKYAVWGIVLTNAVHLTNAMKKYVPQGKLVAGIDIAEEGMYYNKAIIKPNGIKNLSEDTVIVVIASSAHESAKKLLIELHRPFVLIKGTEVKWYNFI